MNLPGKHYLAALVWIVLFGIAYVVIDAQLQPKVATAESAGEIVIPRSRDGHFYVAGKINGQPVTFMVDTGASTVSVNSALAGRLGLPRGRPVAIGTAGGMTQGEEVVGQTVMLGGITVREVRIVVLAGMPGEALLGQNVLRHLEVLQTAERMILRRKPD
ncbi:MAG: TIGR02281 family clan AA aspartic protease [Pseudomonadota bacterium]